MKEKRAAALQREEEEEEEGGGKDGAPNNDPALQVQSCGHKAGSVSHSSPLLM